MASINLRPWREELRQQKQQEYIMVLALVLVAAAAIWWGVRGYFDGQHKNQNQRNEFLAQQASQLDTKIKEISELRNQRTQLLDRMKLIQDLQGNRPVIVRLFDEMARVMPEGVYFEDVKIVDRNFTIKGRAENNASVAQLMRNFDESPWFDQPNLLGVKANKGSYNDFDILVMQSRPASDEVK